MDKIPSKAVIIIDNQDHGRRRSDFAALVEEALLLHENFEFGFPEFSPCMSAMPFSLAAGRDENEFCGGHSLDCLISNSVVSGIDEVIRRIYP